MTAASTGLLVLGMHRSGTSVLARLLNLAGAELGIRVSGAGAGNERGHWEDVFAVELHDRLLGAFGLRWSDPFGLPRDWRDSRVAGEAMRAIERYLRSDRSRHAVWVVKDPRLCLFADLWIQAAASCGLPLSAVVMGRHPMQVAHSLQARDGMGLAGGLALWLDHSAGALASAGRIPSCMVSNDDLYADWRAAVHRIAGLPGLSSLDRPAELPGADAFLEPALRHHADVAGELPPPVDAMWALYSDGDAAARGQAAARLVEPWAGLLQPLLGEQRSATRILWDRVAGAEALLAPNTGALLGLPSEIAELRALAQAHHAQLTGAVSAEIQAMQRAHVEGVKGVARIEADAAAFHALKPRLDAMAGAQVESTRAQGELTAALQALQLGQAGILSAVSSEMRQLRDAQGEAIGALDQVRAEAESARAQSQALRDTLAQREVELDTERRDARARAIEHRRLVEVEDQFRQLLESRSWRWTRPVRVALRILRQGWSTADLAQAARWTARVPGLPGLLGARARLAQATTAMQTHIDRAVPIVSSSRPPAPAVEGVADVFVWSVIDWHFRTQRPQHIARALAGQGHRVFYISNNFMQSGEPGFSLESLDGSGALFQVHLNMHPVASIYADMPDSGQVAQLAGSLAELLAWTGTQASLSLVQHPFWSTLARSVPNARVVYDCMDHHPGFQDNAGSIVAAESELVRRSDLVVVTSDWLKDEVGGNARQIALVRNAGEYAFFSERPAEVFRDAGGRRVIGYYGAIADWFDMALVRDVAAAHPECLVLLVGADTCGAGAALSDVANVRLVGEVAYADLPYWLHGFDVCLLPFKVVPLTLATNPVKVYEYLAAGKPVVSVDLPEMAQFGALVRVAADSRSFVQAVSDELQCADPQASGQRRAFAAGQTWSHRAVALDAAIASIREARVSVVVLTYNNLAYTQACLFSIEAYSDYPLLEVIVVDNASTDGSRDWLAGWQAEPSAAGHVRRLLPNDTNAGFAAGNNIGLAAATGDILVILNNDTYVTPGWVRTLCAHLRRDPALGLVGPVTNNIGNEAKIDIDYGDMSEMIASAARYTRRHPGGEIALPVAAFFCVAMPRGVYEAVGGLDESFGLGFFEDDDYCRRVLAKGHRIACAEDVFVHHHLSASFDAIGAERKAELFARNKAIYEAKWGPWIPHGYRH